MSKLSDGNFQKIVMDETLYDEQHNLKDEKILEDYDVEIDYMTQ